MKRFSRHPGWGLTSCLVALAIAAPADAQEKDLSQRIENVSSLIQKGDFAAVKAAIDADPKIIDSGSRSQGLFYNAVQNGKLDIVRYLLEKGVDPNAEVYGNVPLSMALQRWDESWKPMAELLVEKGAQINATDNQRDTALVRVLNYGGDRQKEKLTWLLSKGADIYQVNRYGKNAIEAAMSGYDANLVPIILEKVDVKKADRDGNTALFTAVKLNKPNFVRLLLDKGSDVNARNAEGETVLHLAAKNPDALTKTLLDAGAKTDVRDNRGDLPLHIALRLPQTSPSEWQEEVQLPAGQQPTPTGTILAPLTEKSDINAKDQFGISPLLLAIMGRDQESRDLIIARKPRMDSTTQLFDAVSQGNVAVVKTLLTQKPFLVYFRLPDGTTPLHVAARWGTLGAAQFLVQKGADVNARNARGVTPLVESLWKPTGLFNRRAKNMEAFLLEKGADVNAPDNNGISPLYWAVKSNEAELVAPLLDRKANVNARDIAGQTPIFNLTTKKADLKLVNTLIARGADIDVWPKNGRGLLVRAVMAQRADIASVLIAKGADINARDDENRSPLASLFWNGSVTKDAAPVIELLLNSGADPNEKIWNDPLVSRVIQSDQPEILRLFIATKKLNLKSAGDRPAPLIQAVQYGRKEMVQILLEAGADPNETDEQGRTAIQIANDRGDEMKALFKPKAAVAN